MQISTLKSNRAFIYSVYQKWKESKFQAEQGEN